MDDDTTLEQLKQISKAKRKKYTHIGLHSVKADEDEKKLQDEYDLDEPRIRLKLKLPKNSNAKRKYVNGSFSISSTIAFAVKSEHNLVCEDSLLVGYKTAPVIHVKSEAPEAEELGCQSTSVGDHLSIDHNKGSSYCGVVSKKVLEVVQSENKEPLLPAKECQSCLSNEIAHDHLEDIEPTCMAVPLDSVGIKGENIDWSCPEFLVLPPTFERRNEVGRALSCRNEPSEYRIQSCFVNPAWKRYHPHSTVLTFKFLIWLRIITVVAWDFIAKSIVTSRRRKMRWTSQRSKLII